MRRVNILGVEISAVNKETAIQYLLENIDVYKRQSDILIRKFNPNPTPFPSLGKGGGSGGYTPPLAGEIAQPGQTVKGQGRR